MRGADVYPVQPGAPYSVTSQNEQGRELWKLPLEVKGAEVVLRDAAMSPSSLTQMRIEDAGHFPTNRSDHSGPSGPYRPENIQVNTTLSSRILGFSSSRGGLIRSIECEDDAIRSPNESAGRIQSKPFIFYTGYSAPLADVRPFGETAWPRAPQAPSRAMTSSPS
jgi:hypothetical protein